MSVIRLNHFNAKPGDETTLFDKLTAVVSMIQSSEGCLDCRILRQEDEAGHIVILEEWVDADAHRAALAKVPPETFAPVMALLAGPPKGAYYL